jgi:hypothetical protein
VTRALGRGAPGSLVDKSSTYGVNVPTKPTPARSSRAADATTQLDNGDHSARVVGRG